MNSFGHRFDPPEVVSRKTRFRRWNNLGHGHVAYHTPLDLTKAFDHVSRTCHLASCGCKISTNVKVKHFITCSVRLQHRQYTLVRFFSFPPSRPLTSIILNRGIGRSLSIRIPTNIILSFGRGACEPADSRD